MNAFKRKALFALAGVLALVSLAGCAGDSALAKANADAAVAQGNARVAEAQAKAEEAKAVQALASKVDAGGATAYLVATALKGLAQPAPAQIVTQAPQNPIAAVFSAVLQVADLGLRAYGIKAGRDVSIASTNAQRDTAIASYGAFTSMGGQIATAGTAGYPYVQAPQPNITLSGTGVIGSGVYTGPVSNTTNTTTNRNCAGGTGAQGGNGAGTTTGGAGGTGGGATGGSC
jgi:hypothetical protein